MTWPLRVDPNPSRPAAGPRTGTRVLYDHINRSFKVRPLGIFNPRDVCGNQWPNWRCAGSVHADGSAGDHGVPVVRPGGHQEGHRLAEWLVTHHRALGVQRVIWAGRTWRADTGRWTKYTGRSDHFDHVHWEHTRPAADGLRAHHIPTAQPVRPPVPIAQEATVIFQQDYGSNPWRLVFVPDGTVYALPAGRSTAPATLVNEDRWDAIVNRYDKTKGGNGKLVRLG